MIIRDNGQEFIMIAQHEHGLLSGVIARHFQKRFFLAPNRYEEVIVAISEHDRGWIKLDDTPIWNDAESVPFTFVDYPLLPKLAFYQFGIEEVEKLSPYAALLCSLHFASFSDMLPSAPQEFTDFCKEEQNRQQQLKHRLGVVDESLLQAHFRLLQLCDDLSLYVCLNEPGAAKADEHPWFRSGFEKAKGFVSGGADLPVARWIGAKEIAVSPPVFEHRFSASLRAKHVPKPLIKELGIGRAYSETEWTEHEFIFSNG
ncbi:DUF3891 family protein [Paenibacillus sp. GCM10012307]|uniref:DUF3891 family protein n=1 Tax=Paenibacillus roseus TaxID=2798579 RepID=A0A934J4T4_9BACL|nr:DUF3891 family protein [Paenibacillus roseus]MBJ6360352.1 DUF3891 family protein [Paenibacillus roseus]